MIELDHGEYVSIIKALNLLSEDLASSAGKMGDYDELSPIARLQQGMDDDSNKDWKELADKEDINLNESTKELLQVQGIVRKFEGEISKIKFRFSIDGNKENANTIA